MDATKGSFAVNHIMSTFYYTCRYFMMWLHLLISSHFHVGAGMGFSFVSMLGGNYIKAMDYDTGFPKGKLPGNTFSHSNSPGGLKNWWAFSINNCPSFQYCRTGNFRDTKRAVIINMYPGAVGFLDFRALKSCPPPLSRRTRNVPLNNREQCFLYGQIHPNYVTHPLFSN